jgi:hypothetical protein
VVPGDQVAGEEPSLAYARIIGVDERVDDEPGPTQHDQQRRRKNDVSDPRSDVN